ncbi:MAG: PAS domain S-box protein [Thermoleophilaceae bacterium]|nr:PAS domain S-box protein [Thermoleophilaceae bacterium]
MDVGAPPPRELTLVARACGGFAILLGLLILIGWATDAGVLIRLAPSLPAAMPNTALMFAASGVALMMEAGAFGESRRSAALGLACALFVIAVAGATLIEHTTSASFGIDNLFGVDMGAEHPGRPATHTVAAFVLLGCCLLTARWRSPVGHLVVSALGAGAAAVVGLAVAGYLIGVPYLFGTSSTHGMSLNTAFGLVVVLTGVFALRPEMPPAAWFAHSGGGEAAARRLMGPALILPFAAGALVQVGANGGLYGQRFGLSIMVVVVAALIQGLIFSAVGAVREHEAIQAVLERESRKNVQRFTTLTSQAPVGIFETDPNGKLIFLNEHWTQITGLSEAQALAGRSAVHPDDRERVQRDWRAACSAGRDYDAEFRFRRPGGEIRWVACHATALRDDAGEVTSLLGSLLDITERRAAEERIALVVDRIAEAVSIIGPDGVTVHVNDAARKILDDLHESYEDRPTADLAWGGVRTDGTPVANDQLPAEITRVTGREIDEETLGFSGSDGSVHWLRTSTRRLSDDGPPYTVVASFADVTEQRQAGARLAEAQARFELAFDHAPIGVTLVSLEGNLLRVNDALCQMFDFGEEDLLGKSFQELTDAEGLDEDLEELGRVFSGELRKYEMEKRYTKTDGSPVWALLSVSLMRGAEGEPRYFIAQVMDITERRRLEGELRHQADHDMLTGIANRRVFATELSRQLARDRRYGGESSLLIVDLDDFKDINDTMGHAVGDLVLQAVANLLSERVRDTDLAARLGGDEFAVLLPTTPREGGEILAIDLVQALRELHVDGGDGKPVAVTASVGVACSGELPEDADDESLLAVADLAMYSAKRTGRDRYAVHDTPAG